jgi:hypothetical protein
MVSENGYNSSIEVPPMTTRYAKMEARVAPSIPAKITYEEFLELPGDDHHVEWVDGEVVAMAPVSDVHADLDGFLIAVLRAYVETHKLGVIRHEPFQMKTGPDLPGRSPDLMFVAKKNLSRLKKNHLQGPATSSSKSLVRAAGPSTVATSISNTNGAASANTGCSTPTADRRSFMSPARIASSAQPRSAKRAFSAAQSSNGSGSSSTGSADTHCRLQ